MRLRIERPTSVPPDALFAWWSDLREGPHDHATFAPGAGERRILARGEGWADVEDRGRFLGLPLVEHYIAVFRAERREVGVHGGNNWSRFSATYRFEEGRAVLEAEIVSLGLLALFDALQRPLVRRFLEKDLEGHLADAARDIRPRG